MPKDEQSEISFGEDVLTVSQVSDYIKNKLCEDPKLKQIYVRGEITNLSKPNPSGHIYFSIKDEKDENSVLECAFFRGKNKDLDFEIKEGLEVLIFGSITGKVPYQAKYLDLCRISWGKAKELKIVNCLSAQAGKLKIVVEYQPLVNNKILKLKKPIQKEINWYKNLVPEVKVGDWVSIHWNNLVQVLNKEDLQNLKKYTGITLKELNQRA